MTTATAIETDQTTPRLLALSEQFPELAPEVMHNGKIKLTVADRNAPIWVEYFDVDARNGADNWRYSLSHTTPKTEFAGTFSHPTEMGCWIMAKRYFAENNYIEIPADNSHLSDKTVAIIVQGQERRSARAKR